MNKYETIRDLGTGSYGRVFLAKSKRNGEQFAIKEIQMTNLSAEEKDNAMKEVQILSTLSNPNIVAHKESFQEKGNLYIVMEYVDGGDLSNKIKTRGNRHFSESDILRIFIQITLALQYIHSKNIVHRDIKPQNIFLTRVGVVKLGDFGVARSLQGTQDLCQTVIGTPFYLSPEIWSNLPYNGQTDIWSLGCILYELCALHKPFQGVDARQLFAAVMRGDYEKLPPRYSSNLRSLVDAMLNAEPSERPTPAQILETPFIQSHMKLLVQQNSAQLKTVNIMGALPTPRSRYESPNQQLEVKKRKRPSKPNYVKQEIPEEEKGPPLPDEEPPAWALRPPLSNYVEPGPISPRTPPASELRSRETPIPNSTNTSYNTINNTSRINNSNSLADDNEIPVSNEYEDLREATMAMSTSLKRSGIVTEEEDLDEIAAKIEKLKSLILEKNGNQLYEMLHNAVLTSDVPSSADFLEIYEGSDPESLENMREIVRLEKLLAE